MDVNVLRVSLVKIKQSKTKPSCFHGSPLLFLFPLLYEQILHEIRLYLPPPSSSCLFTPRPTPLVSNPTPPPVPLLPSSPGTSVYQHS